MATGTEVRTLAGHTESVRLVSISSDGSYVVSGSSDNTVKIWDMATGTEVRTLTGHTSLVESVSISSDGRYVISGLPIIQ